MINDDNVSERSSLAELYRLYLCYRDGKHIRDVVFKFSKQRHVKEKTVKQVVLQIVKNDF